MNVEKLFKRYATAARAEPDLAVALLRIGVLRILHARGLALDTVQAAVILATRDAAQLERWLAAATTVRSVAHFVGDPHDFRFEPPADEGTHSPRILRPECAAA